MHRALLFVWVVIGILARIVPAVGQDVGVAIGHLEHLRLSEARRALSQVLARESDPTAHRDVSDALLALGEVEILNGNPSAASLLLERARRHVSAGTGLDRARAEIAADLLEGLILRWTGLHFEARDVCRRAEGRLSLMQPADGGPRIRLLVNYCLVYSEFSLSRPDQSAIIRLAGRARELGQYARTVESALPNSSVSALAVAGLVLSMAPESQVEGRVMLERSSSNCRSAITQRNMCNASHLVGQTIPELIAHRNFPEALMRIDEAARLLNNMDFEVRVFETFLTVYRAEIFARMSRFDEAVEAATIALRLARIDQQFTILGLANSALVWRAHAYARSNRDDAAYADFAEALEMRRRQMGPNHQDHAIYLWEMSQIRVRQGRTLEGSELAARARQFNPRIGR